MKLEGRRERGDDMGKNITKRAKTLEDYQLVDLRKWVASHSKWPERDDLIFLLSHRAGLRAAEIAKLDIDALTDAGGKIAAKLIVDKACGKYGRAREIPMHPQLADAVLRFRRRHPEHTFIAFKQHDPSQRMSANALTVHMWRIYKTAGFDGASSHSGRRTFVTKLARRANTFSASLRDVQLLAGHASLETTEAYVEPTEEVFSMVASLGTPM